MGYEFVVFVKKDSFDEVIPLFEKVKKMLKTMINFPIHDDMILTMSAGAAFFPGNSQDYKELLNLADQALYEVKQKGKNQIKLCS